MPVVPRSPTGHGASPRRTVSFSQDSSDAGPAAEDQPFDLDNLSNINGKDATYISDNMNNSHPDAIEAMVRHYCDRNDDVDEFRMTGINEDFFTLAWSRAGHFKQKRIPFRGGGLHGRGDAKTALMRIAGQAMTALGMGGPGKFDNRYNGAYIAPNALFAVPAALGFLLVNVLTVFHHVPPKFFHDFLMTVTERLKEQLFLGHLGNIEFLRWVTVFAWIAHFLEASYGLYLLITHKWMVDVWAWTVSVLLFGYPQLSLLTEEVRLHELAKSKTLRPKKSTADKKTD